MPYGWWRGAIERRLATLSAIALIAWMGVVASASAVTINRITATLVEQRSQLARQVADRVEHAIDAELSRLYREPAAANLPVRAQLTRALPALATLLGGFSGEPYRVTLTDAAGRELAASDPPRPSGSAQQAGPAAGSPTLAARSGTGPRR